MSVNEPFFRCICVPSMSLDNLHQAVSVARCPSVHLSSHYRRILVGLYISF
ncbi:hypothetical protein WOLCODRAFT_104841 [Wolfiporia cocos MD-104 SS10]|uniref:Uncharacterized protein n=1 Tax=Wolfiporia cocos (strain MD-104) TaxID=742152 RepID=A0A2H3K2A5_WOLCO|nr:hypothetical protein WOLCODRAFT_104841 [Wolfiporia cocos MD-104 SS10]